MKKMTLETLGKFRSDINEKLIKSNTDDKKTEIIIGMGTCGVAAGAARTFNAFTNEINKNSLKNVIVSPTGCMGLCYTEPTVVVRSPGMPETIYGDVDEETALIKSIEGKRGMPTPKPPFPAIEGLWGKPTIINNVETLANIPMIILKGAKWFKSIGTEKSSGTKVFALTGKISNSGLVEVPMGTTLREIIFEIGGGIKNGKAFKAVQTGGPSGGVITSQFLDTLIDFDQLTSIGSMMGSGGMIVMDENDCIIDVVKFYQDFCVEESCGKCTPCRIGTRKLYDILDKISKGNGTHQDLADMETIGIAMKKAALYGLGQTAPNPILSTLKYFREEYLEHVDKKLCKAGKCKDLVHFIIDPEKCIGCTVCARKCPVNCISGERKKVHFIDQDRCIKCGECFISCKFDAISKF